MTLLTMMLVLMATTWAQAQVDTEAQIERIEEAHRRGEGSATGEMSGEDVGGRQEWFEFQRRFPYDRIPAGARVDAVRQIRAMEERIRRGKDGSAGSGLFAASRWESIGPVNQGGRVRGLAAHPNRPGELYIGAAAGGVWKTTNEGETWRTTFDTMSALAMGAIAIDPSNPNIVYAGTGENTVNIDAYLGDGIFKSTDAGTTWRNIGLNNVSSFSKLFVHRQDSRIVYAATAKNNGGFYRSTDAGATWQKTTLPSAASNNVIYDLSVDPTNSDRLFITSPSVVFRSTDAGRTFTIVSGSASGINTSGSVRMSIALAPSEPQRVYLLMARTGGAENMHIADIYVSTDGGTRWTLRRTFETGFFFNQGWYNNCLAVHPDDPNIVLAGGIDIYRTDDGGLSWTNVTLVYQGGTVHPDQHIIVFDPTATDVVYLGNDGGVYYSVDAGKTWSNISLELPITQYYAMDVDQTRPFRVYGGTQDNGTSGSYGASGFSEDWTHILGGDGFHVVVDLTDPGIIYAENYYGQPLYRIRADNPNIRTRIDVQISTGDNADPGWWSTPIAMSPADRTTLYSGRRFLWRTANPRTSTTIWEKLDPGFAAGIKITAIGLSYASAGSFAVGTHTGEFRYTTSNGATWLRSTGLPGRFITDIEYDPAVASRMYVSVSGFNTGHIFRSDDNGATFTNISSNLPNIPVNTIAIDPANSNIIYLGTDAGVFISTNGGGLWLPFNDGLPLTPIADLKIHRSSRMMIAATHGRSMFRVSIDNPQTAPALVSPMGGESIAVPGTLTVRWIGFNGPVRVLLSAESNEPFVLVANNVQGSETTIELPIVRSTTARVRVEEINTGRAVVSEFFSLNPASNIISIGSRGFVAGALAMRGDQLWAATRRGDTIYKLRIPLLTQRESIVRSGFAGNILDLDHDPTADIFYVLVDDPAAPGNHRVYRMSLTGASLGEVQLPAEIVAIDGITITPAGLVVATPGGGGRIYLLDRSSGAVITSSPIVDAGVERRVGLVWDGVAYVQGVTVRGGDLPYPSALYQLSAGDVARLVEVAPIITTSGAPLQFFGLTLDPGSGERYYYATDSSGAFYRFRSGVLSAVREERSMRARSIAIESVVPNPLHGDATVTFTLREGGSVTLDLYAPDGRRVARIVDDRLDAGRHRASLRAAGIPSGIYYLSLTIASDERVVVPVTIVQ